MKVFMKTTLNCVLVGMKETPYEFNGTKGVRRELSLECDEAVGAVVCDEPTFERAKAIGKYKTVQLCGEYDTQYKRFMVNGIDVAGASESKTK